METENEMVVIRIRRKKKKPGTSWKCIWRKEDSRQVCGQRGPTWSIVAAHVLRQHLNIDPSDQPDVSKNQIDFYMDEDDPSECPDTVSGVSPPTKSHFDMARPRAEDPEYQEQIRLLVQNNHHSQSSNPNNLMIANVISMAPQVQHTESQSISRSKITKPCSAKGPQTMRKAMKQIKPAPGKPLQAYNAPLNIVSVINKVPQSARRVRGETKKCRKVYGMEHKDLWCTQCKWKKACTRFND